MSFKDSVQELERQQAEHCERLAALPPGKLEELLRHTCGDIASLTPEQIEAREQALIEFIENQSKLLREEFERLKNEVCQPIE